MDDFPQKLKKVARIVLYGPAISQSDCSKAGPYQLPYINAKYKMETLLLCTAGGGLFIPADRDQNMDIF